MTRPYFLISLYLRIFIENWIFKNWKIIALQCCAGFCHTTMQTSYKCIYIYIPFPLIPPPTTPHPNPLKLEILNTELHSGNYTVSIPQALHCLLSGAIIHLSSDFSKLFLQVLYS